MPTWVGLAKIVYPLYRPLESIKVGLYVKV